MKKSNSDYTELTKREAGELRQAIRNWAALDSNGASVKAVAAQCPLPVYILAELQS